MFAQKPIVVVGSINTDLVATTKRMPLAGETLFANDFHTHPGGKGANQAVGVARLGYPVGLIGRLGKDAFGTELRRYLQEQGVNIAGIATSECSSGVALITVAENGDNSILVASGANAEVTPADIDANKDMIRNAGMVLAQLEIPLETVEHLARLCAHENVPLMLDPAPAAELPKTILQDIAWFTPNETETAFYIDNVEASPSTAAQKLLSNGCKGIVLKMGSQGVYLKSQDGIDEHVPAFSVKAVDTTAAGDAFNAGFATGLMRGKSPVDAAAFASAVAAISVTRSGAQPSMPTMAEVEAFLKSNSQYVERQLADK